MRLVSAVTGLAFGAMLFVGMASAQQNDPIEERQKLMKANGREATLMTKMVKGELPYDAAKVNEAFDAWDHTAKNVGSLFPDNSKSGHDTRALPKVWTEKAEFEKHLQDFGKDVAAQKAKATSNLDGLKQAMAVIGKDCKGCHDNFRAEKKS